DRGLTKGRAIEEASRVLGEGLLTTEGQAHHRMRRLLQPAFSHQRVDTYAEEMLAVIEDTSASWEDGRAADIHQDMLRVALRAASRSLFSTDLDGLEQSLSEALEATVTTLPWMTLPGAKVWERLPIPKL